ncbi:filamentous hemagglutinin N-terminal domain-containing protein [Moellerella wisconsensis]|uniref:two-partner secretion domain-containing protein n=1 Tax=Moellerella wisconsensis TaxID=158849 RepID=UPI001F4DE3FF|nr:filamentous hemagglutinin N-terminal domain-containing protein [Moellerella wisconsensis]UNH25526.1 filamentous hemagglutinin N-terminal domain-containing protein [Moellerella wisconsensis]
MKTKVGLLVLMAVYSGALAANEPTEQGTDEIITALNEKGFNYLVDADTAIILANDARNQTANVVTLNQYEQANKINLTSGGDNTPVINMNQSDQYGRSHTYFSQLDVGKDKAVYFNNMNRDSATSLIIAEINGRNQTQLKGKIEILGKPAGLIIANAQGIDCDSCSFSQVNDLHLHAGKVEAQQRGKVRLIRTIDGTVSLAGDIDTRAIKSAKVYADKIFIAPLTKIKADQIDFMVDHGDIFHGPSARPQFVTDSGFSRPTFRVNTPVERFSTGAGLYIGEQAEISGNRIIARLVNAKFDNKANWTANDEVTLSIMVPYNRYNNRHNNENRGAIKSYGTMSVSKNRITNRDGGYFAKINAERNTMHYYPLSQYFSRSVR